ncbi:MAG TPA: hypothetical protein DCM45_01325 [Clostridiales bacterium]|nr:hypothetical protein [Clostridiales bacterium]
MSLTGSLHKHIQTGVSFMLPVLIVGGVSQGILSLFAGYDASSGVLWLLSEISRLAMLLAIPVASAYTAYSVADRPALIPAFVVGFLACQIGTGYMGSITGALIIGWLIKQLNKIRIPVDFRSIKAILIVPMISTIITAALLFYILRIPYETVRLLLIEILNNLNPVLRFVLGALLAGIAATDMGGKKGNIVSIFANISLAEGVAGPTPAKIIAASVPPTLLAIADLLDPKVRKNRTEFIKIKSMILTGMVCQITEVVLPYTMKNPRKMIASCIVGSSLAGGLVMYWDIFCPAPHGGLFLLPIMNSPELFVLALLIGSLSGAVVLLVLRRIIHEKQPDEKKRELSDKDVWMNF